MTNLSIFADPLQGCSDCQDKPEGNPQIEQQWGWPESYHMVPMVLHNKIPSELPGGHRIGRDFLCPPNVSIVDGVLIIDGTHTTLPAFPSLMTYNVISTDGSVDVTPTVTGNVATFNLSVLFPAPVSLCDQLVDAASGTSSALEATDLFLVNRGGVCTVVNPALALVDRLFANTTFTYNAGTGVITLTQVDENGVAQPALTVDVGPIVVPPLNFILRDSTGAAIVPIAYNAATHIWEGQLPPANAVADLCPPVGVPAAQLCPQDEVVVIDPATCLPRLVMLPAATTPVQATSDTLGTLLDDTALGNLCTAVGGTPGPFVALDQGKQGYAALQSGSGGTFALHLWSFPYNLPTINVVAGERYILALPYSLPVIHPQGSYCCVDTTNITGVADLSGNISGMTKVVDTLLFYDSNNPNYPNERLTVWTGIATTTGAIQIQLSGHFVDHTGQTNYAGPYSGGQFAWVQGSMADAATLAGVVTALGSTSTPAAAATAMGVNSPDTRYVAIGTSIHGNSTNAGSNILSSSGYATVTDHNYSLASCETNVTIAQSTTNNVVAYQPITQAPGFSHVPKHAVAQLRFTGTGGGAPTWQTIDTATVVLGDYCVCGPRTLAQTVQAIYGEASASLPAGASFSLRYTLDGVVVEETTYTVPASGVITISQRLHRIDADLFTGCADQTHTASLEFKCISISSNPANSFTSTAISLKATGV